MRTRTALIPLALLLSATAAFAAPRLMNLMTLEPQSRLWVSGTSTTRDFECQATSFVTEVDARGPGAASAIVAGQKAVTTVTVDVPAAKLDCRNGTMNSHMLKALKATEHPTISFRLSSYDLAPENDGALVTLNGALTLGGVTKEISMTALAADQGAGVLKVTGSHELRMREYGLKPPSLMLGTLKVNERVNVGFDLYLKN